MSLSGSMVKNNMSTRDFTTQYTRSVFSQGFCEQREAEFLHWLDEIQSQGQVIKDDRKAILVRARYGDREVVVKHYQYIGLIHALGHALTRSRAKYSWQASLKMAALNIPTPKALACVERLRYGAVSESYFVYEFEEGFHLGEYAWFTPVERFFDKPYYRQVIKAIMSPLKQHQISHGDLKMPNILITPRGPILIDLDQVRFHRFKPAFARRYLRDLRRFRRDLPWNRTRPDQ